MQNAIEYPILLGLEITPYVPNDDDLQPDETGPNESPDNYHRLARINLERYRRATPNGNGTLRFWRNEWYKYDGQCYRKIDLDELKAKVGQSIKEEFDRVNAYELANWSSDKKPPTVRNVSQGLVANVIFATAQMCLLSGTVELNSWIDGPCKSNGGNRRYLAMRNGILDVDALLAGESDYLKPHSPDWFSLTCLPFDFDPDAKCPRWFSFLRRNVEADKERIAILKEWFGYILFPDTSQQKFMFLEGEGANGKNVCLSAMIAMVGQNNCSHVQLEAFGKEFMLTTTLGKLLNVSSECSEMDSAAEGILKAMASGDRMTFNRKGIPPIEALPTARLVIAANVRPRFDDKSSGLWRRMILMPWRVTISESERVVGMDSVKWWIESGELPGIFNWALAGLHQLTINGRFSKSAICEAALNDYKQEVNPTKTFLLEHYHFSAGGFVKTKDMYEHYKEWAIESGYRPVSDRTFGRELLRTFPGTTRERKGTKGITGDGRYYAYVGIDSGSAEDAAEHSSQIEEEQFV